ncbi:MAG: TetR/AcrR family transcriptional regulator [Pseudomonadota bacterium]
MSSKAQKTKAKRRVREAEFARDIILEAAASVFARKGFHGATMDNVAREAGYSPAAIYKYFENKEAVFSELIKLIMYKINEVFSETPPIPLAFRDYIRWLTTREFEIAQKHRDLFIAIMDQHSSVVNRDEKAGIDVKSWQAHQAHHNHLVKLMKKGIGEGALRPGNPGEYASAFFGIVHAFAVRWLLSEKPYPLGAHMDTILDLFFNGTGSNDGNGNPGGQTISGGTK